MEVDPSQHKGYFERIVDQQKSLGYSAIAASAPSVYFGIKDFIEAPDNPNLLIMAAISAIPPLMLIAKNIDITYKLNELQIHARNLAAPVFDILDNTEFKEDNPFINQAVEALKAIKRRRSAIGTILSTSAGVFLGGYLAIHPMTPSDIIPQIQYENIDVLRIDSNYNQ